ncbi:GMC family oxidoreductase [Pseudobacteriovorax antillogorgiicola]|uniref:Choline dehydrogenase n=1 Tax=Pseudobacteriovorax antillogorgiicola TaxID=1513793 RepID=A0A1Y6CWM7_9BACT|nr:GMC family oxidoreductase [Pseudobacteriovorax antillogorgiicola]TCS42216.1 choline dehydrogenase [Pseudobacteriovorax antillogorgiicola]SMF82788.1 choline dehydrogenase [Pseudobacteriovorax antillogorgiicola]
MVSKYLINRRRFAVSAGLSAFTSLLFKGKAIAQEELDFDQTYDDVADFVIVGSGAGGGTLAARLVEYGYSVILIDAGPKETNIAGTVPALHASASEDPARAWKFFVKHFEENPERDPKYADTDQGGPGIFYPRGSAIGGSTAVNAMIYVRPHNSDWNHIAATTKDPSWQAEKMEAYHKKVESWLMPQQPELGFIVKSLFDSPKLRNIVVNTILLRGNVEQIKQIFPRDPFRILRDFKEFGFVEGANQAIQRVLKNFSPNKKSRGDYAQEGAYLISTATHKTSGLIRRRGARERLLEVEAKHPDRLRIKADSFVTDLIFDEASDAQSRVRGVMVDERPSVYGAAYQGPDDLKPKLRTYGARREVIVAGGAFNTPQILMNAGIGPMDHLTEMGIRTRIDLPQVGQNLQDRYEVGMVYQSKDGQPISITEECLFEPTEADPCYQDWLEPDTQTVYDTNGTLISFILKSGYTPDPDLLCFAIPAEFRGYEMDYSKKLNQVPGRFTYAILKGHTENRGGRVRLKSRDPYDTPDIDFNYFPGGYDDADLKAVVKGMESVRGVMNFGVVGHEWDELNPTANTNFAEHVMNTAWGHHASCTCPMGLDPRSSVVDASFKVHGMVNLRVVDASVFPRIPGHFIVSSVYAIGEKAADVIHQEYKA